MRTLSIDIETYSSADLIKCGVYKYVQSSDFEILLFAYCYNDEEIKIIDLASGEKLPDEVFKDLRNDFVLKTAYNAAFERACIAAHFKIYLSPIQWECSMAKASMLGLPLSLDAASRALKLTLEKDASGKLL